MRAGFLLSYRARHYRRPLLEEEIAHPHHLARPPRRFHHFVFELIHVDRAAASLTPAIYFAGLETHRGADEEENNEEDDEGTIEDSGEEEEKEDEEEKEKEEEEEDEEVKKS